MRAAQRKVKCSSKKGGINDKTTTKISLESIKRINQLFYPEFMDK